MKCLVHLDQLSRACYDVLKNKQNVIAGTADNDPSPPTTKPHDLLEMPLYTRIEWNEDSTLKQPPDGKRLADGIVFLIISLNLQPSPKRNMLWPADFDSSGDIYPSHCQAAIPSLFVPLGCRSFRYTPDTTPWSPKTPGNSITRYTTQYQVASPWLYFRSVCRPVDQRHPSL